MKTGMGCETMLEFLRKNAYLLSIVSFSALVVLFWYILIWNVGKTCTAPQCNVRIEDDEDAAVFLRGYGFDINPVPLEVSKITLPTEMDSVYRQYNHLQKKAGFDLTPYLGKEVEKRTYQVLIHPYDTQGEVRANFLVDDGILIGGDIMSVALDGFMVALNGEQ